jgi:hypothetical protein
MQCILLEMELYTRSRITVAFPEPVRMICSEVEQVTGCIDEAITHMVPYEGTGNKNQ